MHLYLTKGKRATRTPDWYLVESSTESLPPVTAHRRYREPQANIRWSSGNLGENGQEGLWEPEESKIIKRPRPTKSTKEGSQCLTETEGTVPRSCMHGSALSLVCIRYLCAAWCSCGIPNSGSGGSQTLACSWDPFPPTGLASLTLTGEFVSSLITGRLALC